MRYVMIAQYEQNGKKTTPETVKSEGKSIIFNSEKTAVAKAESLNAWHATSPWAKQFVIKAEYWPDYADNWK